MQHRVPAQSAARACARAHLAYAYEHRIIHYPAGCCRVQHRVQAQCPYAHLRDARMRARRHSILQERGARRRNEILEHASPVLCSGLGKISQTGDLGIVTRPDARAVSSLMARFVQVSLSLLHLANCPALYRNCHFYKRLQNELGNRQTRAC